MLEQVCGVNSGNYGFLSGFDIGSETLLDLPMEPSASQIEIFELQRVGLQITS